MSTPHRCPVCYGRGSVAGQPMHGSTAITITYGPCPACKGACVVWEPPLPPQVTFAFTPAEVDLEALAESLRRAVEARKGVQYVPDLARDG